MNKIVEFLNANPVQYLATVGRDGKAKCRPRHHRRLLRQSSLRILIAVRAET